MKTKEFIKMLQEADPLGEAYVRLPDGGAPYYAEYKAGYWDGPYQYLDDPKLNKPTIITSSQGNKVDIYTIDHDDIVWQENGEMERIKKRIKMDLIDLYPERINNYMHWIEEEAKYVKNNHKNSVEKWSERVIDKYFSGDFCDIRQPLDKPIGHYNCMEAHFWIKKETLCQGECMSIIESGKFYPEKKKKYYIWHYDLDKGKNWSLKK